MTATWSAPGFERVAEWLGERTGLAFPSARVPDAEAGIRRAMNRAGIGEVTGYLDALVRGQAALDDLITELTVGETYFFREPLQWELLRDEVVPALLRAHPADHILRIWSAGCASGEEPYSTAILLDELGLGDRAEIFATDLCGAALEKARAAVYGTWSLRGVDPSRVVSHFVPAGARWRLDDRLRNRVRFARLNLAGTKYDGRWDLILCRNVLIYLDDDTVERVLHQLADCLAPGGWLILGASDPTPDDGALEAVTTKAGVLYRKRDAAATRPLSSILPAPSPRRGESWGEANVPLPSSAPSNDSGLPPPPSTPWRGSQEEEVERPAAEPPPPAPEPLSAARAAFARGDYELARALAAGLPDPAAAVLCVRAMANAGDPQAAERLAASSEARHPTCVELHLLHAVLLLDRGRHAEAAQAARRALYLDRHLVIGHFLLGVAVTRLGEVATARRAFQNARALCASLPPDLAVPFGDGQRAALLAEAAGAQLRALAGGRAS